MEAVHVPIAENIAVSLVAADAPGQYRHGLSLFAWLATTDAASHRHRRLVLAIGWRSRRWRFVWLPVSAAVGLAVAAWAHWWVDSQGMAGDPAPDSLWIWTGLTGFALSALIFGWRGIKWRRIAAVAAVPLCLLGAGLALNTGSATSPPCRWHGTS